MWFEETQNGIIIRIKAQPKASRTEITGVYGDRLKIKLAAPPLDGQANSELLSFLKKTLKVNNSHLHLIRGEKSHNKDVFCLGIDADRVKTLLS